MSKPYAVKIKWRLTWYRKGEDQISVLGRYKTEVRARQAYEQYKKNRTASALGSLDMWIEYKGSRLT